MNGPPETGVEPANDVGGEIARLSSELGRMAEAAVSRSAPRQDQSGRPAVTPVATADLVPFARTVLAARRKISDFLPGDLFSDPARDLLIDLFIAHHARKQVSVSSACLAAAVPATTALRWIHRMKGEGLLVSGDDPQDHRRVYVELSDRALAAVHEYLSVCYRLLQSVRED